MPTLQQKAAVEKLVELRGKSVSRAMRESKLPYSPITAKNPKNLTESKGFQELMEQYGLTDDLLINALVDDIKQKPKHRFKELELGFKVRARLNPEGTEALKGATITNFTQIVIHPPHGTADTGHTTDS